ncbi:MAG: hypothetical protein JNL98_35815 [Bryobacterales bacterium]|nr:hypothetical protein [Bryobacterales bacterium]
MTRVLLLIFACEWMMTAAPRLILTHETVQELRRISATKGSAHASMLDLLKRKVDGAKIAAGDNYGKAYQATSAAFLFQMTKEARYCEVAWQSLQQVYAGANSDSLLPDQGYGLARATVGSGFAYAYDWCGEAWSEDQKSWVAAKLRAGLDSWPRFRHANVEAAHKGSNWVAVCRGGELIEMIALGLEKERAERYALIKADLHRHMQNMDELGVSQEGIGYTAYGGIFLLRAILALRSIGDHDLDAEASRHAWWKQAMYSGTFALAPNGGRIWMMSGVSGPGIGDEGWASLLFAFTPKDQLPYFQWWYDRHMGRFAPGSEELRFDPRREGQVWAMICYPANTPERDPSPVFPKAIVESGGLALFRNRWQDADDILISMHADAKWHSHAWDQPEALQWHVFAYGRSFAGGPEKTRDAANFTTLLVDGRYGTAKGAGAIMSFGVHKDGGMISVDGGSQYERLGVAVTRTMKVDFLGGNRARIGMSDRIRGTQPHVYTWQINVGDHASDGGLRRSGNKLESARGVMNIDIIRPPGAELQGSDPIRLNASGESIEIEVEMELRPKN